MSAGVITPRFCGREKKANTSDSGAATRVAWRSRNRAILSMQIFRVVGIFGLGRIRAERTDHRTVIVEEVAQSRFQFFKLPSEAQFSKPRRIHPLSGGQNRSAFAEHARSARRWNGNQAGAMQHPAQRLREYAVGDRVAVRPQSPVPCSAGPSMHCDNLDQVEQMNPRHPLASRVDRAAGPELEWREHLGERPAVGPSTIPKRGVKTRTADSCARIAAASHSRQTWARKSLPGAIDHRGSLRRGRRNNRRRWLKPAPPGVVATAQSRRRSRWSARSGCGDCLAPLGRPASAEDRLAREIDYSVGPRHRGG